VCLSERLRCEVFFSRALDGFAPFLARHTSPHQFSPKGFLCLSVEFVSYLIDVS
jgi:hypothetical protein